MPPRSLSLLQRGVHLLLELGFAVICLRFLFATGRESGGFAVLLGLAGFGLAWWRPDASLLVLILAGALVSGLEKTVLVLPYSALLVLASSVWVGVFFRRLFRAPSTPPPAGPSDPAAGRLALMVGALAAIALLSFAVQARRQGDPFYFLPGFLWLHGLFYFRALRHPSTTALLTPGFIRLAVLVNALVLLLFLGVQWAFDLPARWTPGFQSAYEDIATLGTMAGCFLLFGLVLFRRDSLARSLPYGAGLILLAVAVAASWSRGAWLATGTFLGVLLFLQRPRAALLAAAALLGVVLLLNLNATRISAAQEPYLGRLLSLVRFENPREKSSARFDLYYKAWSMIQARPLTGHGIGGFYTQSTRYARRGDPVPHQPQFAHNLLLQVAAEQGVPACLLFAGLLSWVFGRGINGWRSSRHLEQAAVARSPAGLCLALALALGTYVQANLTWEMLLVHPSQPFFFWFLVAALWTSIERARSPAGTPAEPLG